MGLLNIIRRMHLRQKLSIREISRLTGVSRNTVTKHLAANTIEPRFATPERPSKIDPFAEKLAGWLKTEAGKSRKQRRTMSARTRLWETRRRSKRAGHLSNLRAPRPARLPKTTAQATNLKPADSRYERGTQGGQVITWTTQRE